MALRSFAAHGWVGWKNQNRPVELIFYFAKPRMFQTITVTCFIRKDYGIQVRPV